MGGLAMQNTKQKKSNFRASAVPLVTVDPYFSVWSFSDTLYIDAFLFNNFKSAENLTFTAVKRTH